MRRRVVLLGFIVTSLFPSLLAAHVDGMNLLMSYGTAPGSVKLDWTGGQPIFQVYRSTTPGTLIAPSNLIGQSTVRTWEDAPGPGAIFFYMLTSPCVYSPPEICDGLDNDCNGTIDDPGSEASCNLPNAVPACIGGTCAVGGCVPGFGNCDTIASNGCENNLTANPNCGSCGNDCNASLGACLASACLGGSCQPAFDNSRCLAPSGDTTTAGACAFATAGCPSAVDSDGDGLSDTWEDAHAIDYNCDGVYDSSDVALPDSDKHVKDVYVKIAWMNPSPFPYPAVDPNTPGCPNVIYTEPPTGHRPQQDSIDEVVRAFAGAHLTPAAQPCGKNGDLPCTSGFSCVDFACLPVCNTDADCFSSCNGDCQALGGAHCAAQGGAGGGQVCRLWRLHVDPLSAAGVPHHDIVSYGEETDSCANTEGGGSMTPGDHANFYDYKSSVFDPKEAAFKHFALFAHDNTCYGTGSPGCGDSTCPAFGGTPPQPNTTGISEIKGNDSIVSLSLHQIQMTGSALVTVESSTFMHELGHNLGLDHSGPVDTEVNPDVKKVNYISVMNYLYQNAGIPFTDVPGSTLQVSTHPDFSHQSLVSSLFESSLTESDGIGAPGLQEPSTRALIRYVSNQTPVCPCPIDPCTGLPYPKCGRLGSGAPLGAGARPIDWNCDGDTLDTGLAADINGNGIPGEVHNPTGTEDYTHLFYAFQCQPTYANGAPVEPGEIAAAGVESALLNVEWAPRPPRVARLAVQHPVPDPADTHGMPAILFGSASFNVRKIDPLTVRLAKAAPIGDSVSIADYDGDGYPDLKADFRLNPNNLSMGAVFLHMTGSLVDGTTFNARDTIASAKP